MTHPPHRPAPVPAPHSLLPVSVAARLGVVAAAAVMLWLAVAWALS
jgi:hypothetical protein